VLFNVIGYFLAPASLVFIYLFMAYFLLLVAQIIILVLHVIIILKMNWKWYERNSSSQISGAVPICFPSDRGKTP